MGKAKQRKKINTGIAKQQADFLKIIEIHSERERRVERSRDEAKALLEFYQNQQKLEPKDSILMELLSMSFADVQENTERSPYLSQKEKTRQLGEQLNFLGGFRLMSWAAQKIPLSDQRQLEVTWHGIGTWKC